MQGAGCRVQGAGCRVQGAGCMVQGVWCRVQGVGCRVDTLAFTPKSDMELNAFFTGEPPPVIWSRVEVLGCGVWG